MEVLDIILLVLFIPGIVIGVFVDDSKSGRFLPAQAFTGMSLEDAVKKAETEFDSPY